MGNFRVHDLISPFPPTHRPVNSLPPVKHHRKSPNKRQGQKQRNRSILQIPRVDTQPMHEEPHRPHKDHHSQDANPAKRQMLPRVQSPPVFLLPTHQPSRSQRERFQDRSGRSSARWVLEVFHQQPCWDRRYLGWRFRLVFVCWVGGGWELFGVGTGDADTIHRADAFYAVRCELGGG